MSENNYNFGAFLNLLSKKTKNFVVLNSLVKNELSLDEYIKANEDRFFDFGFSVSTMVSAASGFLLRAKTPVVLAYTDLLVGKAYSNIRNDFCLNNSNIRIVGIGAGFDNGLKGGAYQYFEEIGILKNLWNIKIICPSSIQEFFELFEKSLFDFGPIFFRLAFDLPSELKFEDPKKINDVENKNIVLTYGKMYSHCLEAIEILKDDGIEVNLINVSQVFPFELSEFEHLLSAKNIVLIEDQNENALFSEISKKLTINREKAEISFLGIQNKFSESGKSSELFKKYSLDYLSLYRKLREILI